MKHALVKFMSHGAILPRAARHENRFIVARMHEKKSTMTGRVPLNSLRTFEAAARHESFARAAHELHVTHGAVSRQIKQLEAQLEVALFERRNRAVFLTEQGATLLKACSDAMEQLAVAIRAIKKPPKEPVPLVLSCEPTVAMRWLIPRLADFRNRYPDCAIHLLTAGGSVDFARDRVDVALRRNDFNWGDDCHAEPVAPEMTGPVCSPSRAQSLQRGNGAGETVPLHSRTRPSAWKRWQEITGETLEVGGADYFEHFYLSLQAASAGLGVAIGSAYMVEDDLRDGRLVAPFGFVPDGSQYVLLSPVAFRDDPRRLVFLDWLRHAMGKSRLGIEHLTATVAARA